MGRVLRSEALRREARAEARRGEAPRRQARRGRRVAASWLRALARAASTAALATLGAGAALAAEPRGIWFDHTGRGAVEITACGSALCGRVVWLRDAYNRSACGLQIIGNVRPAKGGAWDGGWIYDPDKDAKYSVEITPIGTETLKVVGYLGSKLLSETMLWRRAPADLKRCHA
jgi:uncharacterized protein (DUF2147 family)